MRYALAVAVALAIVPLSGQGRGAPGQERGGNGPSRPEPLSAGAPARFASLFYGPTRNGWDGDPACWHVEAGALVGQSTPDNAVKQNTFLIWRGGEPKDFELKVEYRPNPTNSGTQTRR